VWHGTGFFRFPAGQAGKPAKILGYKGGKKTTPRYAALFSEYDGL